MVERSVAVVLVASRNCYQHRAITLRSDENQ